MTNLEANRIARELGRKGYDTEIVDVGGIGLEKAVRVSADLPSGSPVLACWGDYGRASAEAAALPTAH
jgi:hypothetical protein